MMEDKHDEALELKSRGLKQRIGERVLAAYRASWSIIWPLVLLVGCWLLLWWPVWVLDRQVFIRDLTFYALPLKAYWLERILHGGFPFWNPHVSGGTPFFADPTNQVLYPLNAVFFWPGFQGKSILETAVRGLTAFCTLHSLLGFWAMWGLARRVDCSRWVATGVALIYGLSGYVVSASDNVSFYPAVVWIPFTLMCWLGVGHRRWVGVCLGLVMLLLAGDPFNAAALSGVMLLEAVVLRKWENLRQWLWAMLGFVGITAVQWIPTVELWQLSVRQTPLTFEEVTLWSFPWPRLVEWGVPFFYGAKYPEPRFWGMFLYPEFREPWVESIYLGVIPLGFALLGAVGQVAQKCWRWVAIAVGSLLLGLGRDGFYYPVLLKVCPFLAMLRYPEKWLLWTTIALCVLAGLGVKAALEADDPKFTLPKVRPWVRRVLATGYHWIHSGSRLQNGLVALLWIGVGELLWAGLPMWFWMVPHMRELSMDWAGHRFDFQTHALVIVGVTLLGACLWWGWWWLKSSAKATWVLFIAAVLMLLTCHGGHVPLVPVSLWNRTAPPQVVSFLRANGTRDVHGAVGHENTMTVPRLYYDDQYELPEYLKNERLLSVFQKAYDMPELTESYPVHWAYKFYYNQERLLFNYGMVWDLSYLNGRFSPLQLKRHQQMDQVLLEHSPALAMVLNGVDYVVTALSPHNPQWDQAGFVPVYEDDQLNLRVLAVQGTLPKAYLVQSALYNPDDEIYQFLTPRFQNYKKQVELKQAESTHSDDTGEISSSSSSAESSETSDAAGALGNIQWHQNQPEIKTMSVTVPWKKGYLVLLESDFPGWHVDVDGIAVKDAPLLANHRYMAVPLEKGAHLVSWHYEANSFGWAVWISVFSVLGLCGVVGREALKNAKN